VEETATPLETLIKHYVESYREGQATHSSELALSNSNGGQARD